MKVLHLSYSDNYGGAFIAARRIHSALLSANLDSIMWVSKLQQGDERITAPGGSYTKARNNLNKLVAKCAVKCVENNQNSLLSPALLRGTLVKKINNSDADVVNLHWINGEMLSISDIGRITKPIVWTLHDMWPLCGAEHYAQDDRWQVGYNDTNRPKSKRGFDLNRWVWNKKKRHWTRKIHLVSPSQWLSQLASQSLLFRGSDVTTIGHPIDLTEWHPVDRSNARLELNLPENTPLILFGAVGGVSDPRKGFDLLLASMQRLKLLQPNFEVVVFGGQKNAQLSELGVKVHVFAHTTNTKELIKIYSAADVFALPSRQEALGLTGMEALSCGLPVVAFGNSGSGSMIKHEETGFIVPAFDVERFAHGLKWCIHNSKTKNLDRSARIFAEQNFAPVKVANQYKKVYEFALDTHVNCEV